MFLDFYEGRSARCAAPLCLHVPPPTVGVNKIGRRRTRNRPDSVQLRLTEVVLRGLGVSTGSFT